MPGLGDQRRYYAAAEATKEPPAGPETPVGWELVQMHATQRAEQSKKRKPFKLQSTQVYQALTGLSPAEQVRVRFRRRRRNIGHAHTGLG